jgi:signal transduction histidine kinase
VEGDDTLDVAADPALIDQLLWNLLDNAVKFTPGPGRVSVSVVAAGDDARITIRDTGPGIPADDVARIFERFYRADTARSSADGAWGTGLGLSIVRAIAEVHGGRVEAANAPDGGAVFTVHLPLVTT